ncbi:MAG: hypothetical protein CM1200mP2_41810 [Planctomycetaceae bacterium]|nr:MAG: hypothetical protein CM1200mP2_41810 [Planctomycetaceae bacterium]
MLAYGSLSVVVDRVSSEQWRNLLYGIIATSNLLHFYYDGFIWKVREAPTRRSLGVEDGPDGSTASVQVGATFAWRHWLALAGLAGLAGALFVTEGRRVRRGQVGDLEMARAVVAHVPGSVAARNELARTLINANRFSEAMAQADTATRLEPDVYKSYVYRGVAGIESGRHEQGLADLLAAERRHSGDAYLQYHLAMAKLELGRMDEAVEHLEASRTIRPGNPDVHYNLGVLRLQQGMRRSDRKALVDAGEHFRMAIERDRSHAHAVCMLGEVERQLGRTGPAIEMFRRSLSLDGSSPEAHHGLSLALREAGEFGEANRALAVAVYHALVEVRAGSGLSGQRTEQAVDWSEELVERSERSDPTGRELLGLAHAAAGNWPQAVSSVERALGVADATRPDLSATVGLAKAKLPTATAAWFARNVRTGGRRTLAGFCGRRLDVGVGHEAVSGSTDGKDVPRVGSVGFDHPSQPHDEVVGRTGCDRVRFAPDISEKLLPGEDHALVVDKVSQQISLSVLVRS